MSSSNVYHLGALVRVSTTFTDLAGALANPSIVKVIVTKGNGTATTYTFGSDPIVNDSTGKFHLDVTADVRGQWVYEWQGRGTLVADADNDFFVQSAR